MRIVEIRSSEDITIEFFDLHNMKKKTTYSNFKNGGIKNPYDRSLKGVGYLGEGKYMTGQSEYDRRVFGIWIGMIDRCYNENVREKYKIAKTHKSTLNYIKKIIENLICIKNIKKNSEINRSQRL